MQNSRFVNKKSVNADPLPTISLSTPSFDVREKVCTFADVEERPRSDTPTPEGRRQMFSSLVLFIMAKSKSGGTRSYIRGRVGADVYSIGKDAKGKKQQVVRSLAESVANPQTESQMRGRMIMSTVMQAESALAFIVDHSFDNVPNGQPSLSEFIRRNYALVKADVAAHPASGNSFGLNKYQEKGAKAGAWVIAAGSAVPANASVSNTATANIDIPIADSITAETLTVKAIREGLGLSSGDYITHVFLTFEGLSAAVRIYMPDAAQDAVIVSAANFADTFKIEAVNCSPMMTANSLAAEHIISVYSDGVTNVAGAVITSRKSAEGWIHNDAVMTIVDDNPEFSADVALPTYPVGAARFLNGGDI